MKNILVLLADWANGMFSLLLAAYVSGIEILWWYIPIALLVSHVPDIDAVPELLRRGKVAASAEYAIDHRTFLHYPLVSVLLSVVAGYVFGFWGWVVCFAVILHLINDMYGTGWGIPLFWPFSKRHVKIFGRRANKMKRILLEDKQWNTIEDNERRLRFVVTWSDLELAEYIQKWGMDDWIEHCYLHLNWVNVIGYSLFLAACVLTAFYFI